jgi:hypothetical protein
VPSIYKKWKIDKIITIFTVVTTVLGIYLVIRQPEPVAQPQSPAAVAVNAQSFTQKLDEVDKPRDPDSPPAEVHFTGGEVSAAIAAASGEIPASQLTPNTDLGAMPQIQDKRINFEGDQARGQFLVNLAGKDVWLTVSGRIGSQEGYVTFDPTEFKVGSMSIPVSLVNGPLQKKLAEQRSQLKLPDNIGGVKIQNGELVVTQK